MHTAKSFGSLALLPKAVEAWTPMGSAGFGDEAFVGVAFVEVYALGAAFVHVDDFGVIEAEEAEDGCVDVVDVHLVFRRIKAEVVGGADGLATFDSASGHPHGEASGVVVPSIAFFAHRGTAEFATPDDEGFVEEAALFEVGDEADDGLVDLGTKGGVFFSMPEWLSHLLPVPW